MTDSSVAVIDGNKDNLESVLIFMVIYARFIELFIINY